MNLLGLEIAMQNIPELDPGFIPLGRFFDACTAGARQPVAIGVGRENGLCSVYETRIHGTPDKKEIDTLYLERLVKYLLWCRGGVDITLYGAGELADTIIAAYTPGGARDFDYHFMGKIYDRPVTVTSAPYSEKVAPNEQSIPAGGHLDGCRIGFDAGGSDRKVSAVVDGEAVYSEEVVWYPKTISDPDYHFNGILEAMWTAASKMPRVDAIGVSSAGIFVDNCTKATSLFLKVPEDVYQEKCVDIYIRAAAQFGNVPLVVANDGDVTALAGAMELQDNRVLGIAMGTSQAAGYVDANGGITGWLNELAFVPVDANPAAMVDDWSGDVGVGGKYFSQDAVIKLAPAAGIPLDADASPAEKLKAVQTLMEQGDPRAAAIFRSIGVYLGHSIYLYSKFYDIKHMLLLGRVMSGQGGNLILSQAQRVLREEYPVLSEAVILHLPDESSRRVGQSVAAASLPQIGAGPSN